MSFVPIQEANDNIIIICTQGQKLAQGKLNVVILKFKFTQAKQ